MNFHADSQSELSKIQLPTVILTNDELFNFVLERNDIAMLMESTNEQVEDQLRQPVIEILCCFKFELLEFSSQTAELGRGLGQLDNLFNF